MHSALFRKRVVFLVGNSFSSVEVFNHALSQNLSLFLPRLVEELGGVTRQFGYDGGACWQKILLVFLSQHSINKFVTLAIKSSLFLSQNLALLKIACTRHQRSGRCVEKSTHFKVRVLTTRPKESDVLLSLVNKILRCFNLL